MARYFGTHMFRLKPGANREEFEKAMARALPQYPLPEGLKAYLLRDSRRDSLDRYLLLYEADSIALRERCLSASGEYAKELDRWFKANRAGGDDFYRVWNRFVATELDENHIFTNYVVLVEKE